MGRVRGLALAVVVAFGGGSTGPRQLVAQLAIITHRDTPLANLTLDELRRLYLGQSSTVGSGVRVTLVDYAPARGTFCRLALHMSELQYERAWVQVVFQGGDAAPPRRLSTPEEVRRFVAEHRGAIAFIEAAAVDASVKVVTIGGFQPSQPEYPIR